LRGRSFAEEGEILSVLSELTSEIPPDMILWLCLLMEGEYVKQSLNLLRLSNGLDKRAGRVRVLNDHVDIIRASKWIETNYPELDRQI
jgi:hypothetical protein